MGLTQRQVDAFKYDPEGTATQRLWDDKVTGLFVRVYPTGKKTFGVRYRHGGRQRALALGSTKVLNLGIARRLARERLGEVLHGVDPLDERERQRGRLTIGELCDEYIERHAKVRKKTWQKDQRRLDRHVRARWGKRKVTDVARADVARLHQQIGKDAPYEANRLVEILRKMFNLAATWGYLDEDAPNPARKIERFREQKRDRWVTAAEMPKLAKAIDAEANIYIRAALWLLLLTGLRKSELLTLEWDEVDLDEGVLRIDETKSGRSHTAPLGPEARALLEALPSEEGNPFVFPGRRKGAHLVNIDKAWRKVRAKAGVEDVRLHDLRRTFGAWLAQSGSTLLLIGRALNHQSLAATQVYARMSQDPVRDAVVAHEGRLLAVARGKKPADVVRHPAAGG